MTGELDPSEPLPERPPPGPAQPPPPAPEAFEPELSSPADPPAPGAEPPAPPPAEPRVPRRITRVHMLAASTAVLGVLAVLLALMVFVPRSAPLKLGATRLAADAQAEQEIKEVAGRFATNFLSLDYRTIDADVDRMLRDATGRFEEQVRRTIDVTRARLTEAQGVSRGRLIGVAVLSRSGETATVRASLRRTIRNAENPDPQTVEQTLDITLVETSSGWKVSDAAGLAGAEGIGG